MGYKEVPGKRPQNHIRQTPLAILAFRQQHSKRQFWHPLLPEGQAANLHTRPNQEHPMKAFLQLINDTPNCEYHQETRNLHKNWAANIIATENGNLLKCVFNDADGTVKLLIREDLFPMAEEGLATAWKKVTTRHSDEDFTTQKGKGKGKAKSSSSTARGVQDYLYKVHLVRVRPLEDDEDP